MHGRTSIRTSQPSAQKDLWAAFTINANSKEQRVLFAKPSLFKQGRVISPIKLLQGQMLAMGTRVTTTQHEQAASIPTPSAPDPSLVGSNDPQEPRLDSPGNSAIHRVAQLTLWWDLTDDHVAATAA